MDIRAAGGIVLDADGRLLLVQRGRPPAEGSWSIPGGKCRIGEPAAETCARELAEETGLTVEIERLAGRVHRAAPGGDRFVIDDFVCRVVAGDLLAGDDAVAAGWFSYRELAGLALVDGLLEALGEWGLLPR